MRRSPPASMSPAAAIGDSGEEQRLIKTLPRKGIRFVGAVAKSRAVSRGCRSGLGGSREPALALPDKPSIAVLPFVNLSSDPEQEYFADGMAETSSRSCRGSRSCSSSPATPASIQGQGRRRAPGRPRSRRALCAGGQRAAGDRVRISAQLVDAATGPSAGPNARPQARGRLRHPGRGRAHHRAFLAAHVNKAETERTRAKSPNSWEAYDYYLQGADTLDSLLLSFSAEDLYEARRLLRQSLSIDAGYARAYALLSTSYTFAWLSPLDGDFLRSAALEEAYQLARKAIQLELNLPQAHATLGYALLWLRQPDASIIAFEKAIALNPNYSDPRYAGALVAAGHPARAISEVEVHMRRDPFYLPVAPVWAGVANYLIERYAEALPLLRDCVLRAPNFFHARGWLAATHAQLGQLEEARAEVAEMLRLHPGFTVAGMVRISPLKHARDRNHYHDGLRKAGLPE